MIPACFCFTFCFSLDHRGSWIVAAAPTLSKQLFAGLANLPLTSSTLSSVNIQIFEFALCKIWFTVVRNIGCLIYSWQVFRHYCHCVAHCCLPSPCLTVGASSSDKMTSTYFLYFLRLSKFWNILHHGSVGWVHKIVVFHHKICVFIIFTSFVGHVLVKYHISTAED